MIAALFVDPRGCYFDLEGVELWDEARDARLYAGPHPVVAHPPCSRWCRLAGLVEARWGHKRGDDGGCFASALANVRRVGGGPRAPRVLGRLGHVRATCAGSIWRMVSGSLRWMVLPRRAGAVRAPGEESDLALRFRGRCAAFTSVGADSGPTKPCAGLLVREPRCLWRVAPARRQAASLGYTARVPRRAA